MKTNKGIAVVFCLVSVFFIFQGAEEPIFFCLHGSPAVILQ